MPQTKSCQNCQTQFTIRPEDQKFYQELKVPEPTHCPACRRQRRQVSRNERHLHKRPCDKCQKTFISAYPKDSEYIIYCYDCWWSDEMQGHNYKQDYDCTRPFFDLFYELELKIPHLGIFKDPLSEDCEYCNYGQQNKSCYLAMCFRSEHVYYTHGGFFAKYALDSHSIISCELCCECIDCENCYQVSYSHDCQNCNNSKFLKDCKHCKNCFLCAGQNNKEYMVMNQQLTKEQYEDYLRKIDLSYEMVKSCQKQLHDLSIKVPKKFFHGLNNENVSGDYLNNCHNCYQCFDCLDNLNESTYTEYSGASANYLYDCSYSGVGSDYCYECCGMSRCNNTKFNIYCKPCSDSDYTQYCTNCTNLFGCYGLQNKSYCILNKQYSPEEYHELRLKIIEHMKSTKEYGEFFPIKYSSFAYNQSVVNDYYPMTKDEVLAKGWKWYDDQSSTKNPATTIPPKLIQDVPSNISQEILACELCQKNYKTIPQEINLRKQLGVPLNPYCPNCRYLKVFNLRNKRTLFKRQCVKCQTPIKTTYSPDGPEIVYCKKCYLDSLC